MNISLRKAGRYLAHSLLGIVAVFFLAVFALQILLTIGINIFNTGRGTNFIERQINTAIQDSGYQIGLDGLYYDPVNGFSLRGLSLADHKGTFVTLDHFTARISLLMSPLRGLDIFTYGGTLSLLRAPETQENEEESDPPADGLSPFETPDIFFERITFANYFDKIILYGEEGKTTEFSPATKIRLRLQDGIALALEFSPGLDRELIALGAPKGLAFEGKLTPETLEIALDQLIVAADRYTLEASGTGNLSGDGALDFTALLKGDDLSSLSGDALDAIDAKIIAQGTLKAPLITANLDLETTRTLQERGLGEAVQLTIESKNSEESTESIASQLAIVTTFKNEPVAIETIIAYQDPYIRITDLKGSAPDIMLQGAADIALENSLVDGKITLSATNLARYRELAGIDLSGALNAELTLKPDRDAKAQSADISASIKNGVFDIAAIRSLSAEASLASLSTPWPQSANLDLSGLTLNGNFHALDNLSATLAEEQNSAAQTEEGAIPAYRLSLEGKGGASLPIGLNGGALLSNLSQKIPTVDDIALTIKNAGSSARISGALSPEQIDITIAANNFKGSDIPAITLPANLADMGITLDASIKGPLSEPLSDLEAALTNLGIGDYQGSRLDIKAVHDGKIVTANLSGQGRGIRALNGDITLPLALSLEPFAFTLDENAALSGTIKGDLDLAAISPLFLSPVQSLSGALALDGTIAGTLSSPAPNAAIKLSGAAFEDRASSITIADIMAAAAISRDAFTLSSLSATDGKNGRITGKGTYALGSGSTDMSVTIDQFAVRFDTMANGVIGADLNLRGTAQDMLLSGKANIAEMQIAIPERFNSSIPELNIVEANTEDSGESFLDHLALDIGIDAPNQIFVRGWGLDAEFGGNIAVSGTAAAPELNGMLSAHRGRFEDFGKRFTLPRANIRFQGTIPPSPYLDIEAQTVSGDITGSVLLTGSASDPKINFSSTPALPEEEVLSHILFGKDSTRITPFQAVQLAQTVRRYSGQGGGGGLDPMGMIRSLTGLDDISVQADEDGSTSVGVGKYITDKVYLEVNKGSAESAGSATIQIEVTPSIKIESEVDQNAQSGGGIFWKHNY